MKLPYQSYKYIQQMQRQEEGLSPQQAQLEKLRLQMVQIWGVFLFNSDHRCILNHICAQTEAGRKITLKTLAEFKNSLNLTTELKNGYILSFTECKQEKTSIVKINPNFCNVLGKLIELIKARINPQLEKIRQFNPQEKKKRCQECNTQKTESQINFMGPLCNCPTPRFVDIKQDPEKRARYEQVERLLVEIITRKKRYEDLDSLIQRKKKEREEMKERQLSDLQKFMQKQGISRTDNRVKVQKNYQNLMLAIKMFSPNREYEKVKELKELKRLRELRKEKNQQVARSPF